ncbi:MAG: site-2 protease family protein [Actinomycetota bacterium]
MTSSITLGRIAGIRIGIHWSWLVVFGLITWSLATAVFPDQNPGLGDATYVVMAVVAAVLFFTSLLMHELGHAFQARREGMEIDGITLWLFGGVAQFRGMFPSAGAEFRIAVAGPLVSLVLGAGFVGLAFAITGIEALDGIAAWLGYINLALLVFNLLPALPLDGGRVLRSALWAARSDFAWATRIAASIGRAFGALMIAGGVALFFFSGLATNGLWLAVLGWFLFGAATDEARYAQVYRAFAGLRVRDLMVPSPKTVSPGQTIAQLMDGVVWTDRQDAYPVVEGGSAVGLLPFRVIADVPRGEWDARTAGERMLPLAVVPVLSGDEPLEHALRALSGSLDRGLVVDDGQVSGVISLADLARAVQSRS